MYNDVLCNEYHYSEIKDSTRILLNKFLAEYLIFFGNMCILGGGGGGM